MVWIYSFAGDWFETIFNKKPYFIDKVRDFWPDQDMFF